MLETYLSDNVRARVMNSDGTYTRLKPPSDDKAVDVQEWLMKNSYSNKKILTFWNFVVGDIPRNWLAKLTCSSGLQP